MRKRSRFQNWNVQLPASGKSFRLPKMLQNLHDRPFSAKLMQLHKSLSRIDFEVRDFLPAEEKQILAEARRLCEAEVRAELRGNNKALEIIRKKLDVNWKAEQRLRRRKKHLKRLRELLWLGIGELAEQAKMVPKK